jgi:hypothetical protein
MKKLAHVPIQTWRGWTPNDLFGGWFSALGRFKTLIGVIGLVLEACLILPCLVPWHCNPSRPLYGSQCRKKNGCTCNDAMVIQTPRSR